MKLYDIEYYCEAPLNMWMKMSPTFVYMKRGQAEGAWAMLKAHYGQKRKHRLVCNGVVIEEWGKAEVHVN